MPLPAAQARAPQHYLAEVTPHPNYEPEPISLSAPTAAALLIAVDEARQRLSQRLLAGRRSEFGQFFTPSETASLMAAMVRAAGREFRLLDAGAGIGSLTAALIASIIQRPERPARVSVTCFEVDRALTPTLENTLNACAEIAAAAGIEFAWEVRDEDFVAAACAQLSQELFTSRDVLTQFDAAILNPPYRKIRSDSQTRAVLRTVGIETSNLYTAFLALAIKLLRPGGELVAITPRSFCNGPYFRPFRQQLLEATCLNRIHVFERRDHAFRDDDVLQENVILHAEKRTGAAALSRSENEEGEVEWLVRITQSQHPADPNPIVRDVPMSEVVHPRDPQLFIHLVPDDDGSELSVRLRTLRGTLALLGVKVSTGRVVDFRAREWLRAQPDGTTVPLLYPVHMSDRRIVWPATKTRKPNAIVRNERTEELLVPSGFYVLVKRFTSKEEPRRVVAAVLSPSDVESDAVGLENHLNYYHSDGCGLSNELAHGLAAYLNSTPVDRFVRHFSGHTQVNATDLRGLPYPTRSALEALGRVAGSRPLDQGALDAIVEELALPSQGVV